MDYEKERLCIWLVVSVILLIQAIDLVEPYSTRLSETMGMNMVFFPMVVVSTLSLEIAYQSIKITYSKVRELADKIISKK